MSKNIIITGTSRGIGYELAQLFAKSGHNVLALSRNNKTIEALNLKNVTALSFDLSNKDDYKKIETWVQSNWQQVDILIILNTFIKPMYLELQS